MELFTFGVKSQNANIYVQTLLGYFLVAINKRTMSIGHALILYLRLNFYLIKSLYALEIPHIVKLLEFRWGLTVHHLKRTCFCIVMSNNL